MNFIDIWLIIHNNNIDDNLVFKIGLKVHNCINQRGAWLCLASSNFSVLKDGMVLKWSKSQGSLGWER